MSCWGEEEITEHTEIVEENYTVTIEPPKEVVEAAKDSSVTVLPGVLIRCAIEGCDDVVLSVLFPEGSGSEVVVRFLSLLSVPSSAAGDRRYVVQRDFAEVLQLIDDLGGIALPSRMDKTPTRKVAIPVLVEKYGFRAFYLAYYPDSIYFFKKKWPQEKFQLFSFSNASVLAQIGARHSRVRLSQPGLEGIKLIVERV